MNDMLIQVIIDSIENNQIDFQKQLSELSKRLGLLEEIDRRLNYAVELPNEFDIRLGVVERIVEMLSNNLRLLLDHQKKVDQPYKCPVCDGKGQWFEAPKDEYHCNACEGKGIVWG